LFTDYQRPWRARWLRGLRCCPASGCSDERDVMAGEGGGGFFWGRRPSKAPGRRNRRGIFVAISHRITSGNSITRCPLMSNTAPDLAGVPPPEDRTNKTVLDGPRSHGGYYKEVLQRFHNIFKPETYLEIGVAEGTREGAPD